MFSIWCVCGNISTGCNTFTENASDNRVMSLARVTGLHEIYSSLNGLFFLCSRRNLITFLWSQSRGGSTIIHCASWQACAKTGSE